MQEWLKLCYHVSESCARMLLVLLSDKCKINSITICQNVWAGMVLILLPSARTLDCNGLNIVAEC